MTNILGMWLTGYLSLPQYHCENMFQSFIEWDYHSENIHEKDYNSRSIYWI